MKVLLLCCLVAVLNLGQAVPIGSETISIEYLDPCRNPKDPGPCEALVPSFYYNNDTGMCEEFFYGGCKGNSNRFPSSEDCKAACVTREKHICNLTPEPGVCLASFLRYFYDPREKKCKTFTYGGCQGNGNNFKTLSECSFTCAPKVANHRCEMPSDAGNCYAHMIRYYYDHEAGTCLSFVYGGCQGNENNFVSEQECLSECGKKDKTLKLRTAPVTESLGCGDVKCDQRTTDDYKLKGCKPVLRENNCCPERYECPEQTHDSSLCYLKGTVYKIGDSVDGPTACLKNCTCVRVSDSEAHVTCDTLKCTPSETADTESHYDYYSPGECCPTRKTRSKDAATCDVDGRKYTEGEKIYFSGGCQTCLCTKDFTGPDGPGCEKEFCGLDQETKLLKGCVPAYQGKGCCPTKWLCPSDDKPLTSARNAVDCISPREGGVCEENIERFYYDPLHQECSSFTYTGCGGNANNFVSEEECRSTCKDVRPHDVCRSDAETGQCKAAHVRWYHNNKEGKCQTFIYGGCGGNFNNFKSQQECEDLCRPRLTRLADSDVKTEDVCSLDAETGPCKAAKQRFYFDKETGECKEFTYGGCEGNGNRFDTQEECLSRCDKKPTFKIEGRSDEVSNPCSLPKNVGPCKAAMPRFYYNNNTGVCESFVYGGCDGNANNFLRMEECHSLCAGLSEKSSKITKEKVCQLPPVLGTCKAILLRYHFDPSDQQCKSFVYGGCEGNQNNFESEERCLDFCLPQENETRDLKIEDAPKICSQSKETGKCKAKIKRYHYDVESQSCLPFYYGGCGGNTNNFESFEECDIFCAAQKDPPTKSLGTKDDVCSLPNLVGPCRGFMKRYYYDSDVGYCKTFTYGGCQGNRNNFVTLADCEDKCGFNPKPGHENDYCKFGNKTIPPGADLTLKDDPCVTCVCETPPQVSCRTKLCPQLLLAEDCVIEPPKPGECCEGYSCGHNKDQKASQPLKEPSSQGIVTPETPSTARTKRQLVEDKKANRCNPSCGPGEVCVNVATCKGCQRLKQCIPKDKSCAGHKCPKGTACELQQVQCIVAPCYPITVCNPK